MRSRPTPIRAGLQPDRSAARGALGVVAGAAFTVAFIAAGVIVERRLFADRVVLDVDPAIAAAPPTTIPTDASQVARQSPSAIAIASVDLLAPVIPVGIDDSGELVVPDEHHVGWYEGSSAPGLPGATVLAAHVTWNRTVGPFHQLGDVEPGDEVTVFEPDGSARVYEVFSRELFPKDELPPERIWTTVGHETLVLITCGGSYDEQRRRYRDNVVVFALPVASRLAPTGAPPPG